MASTDTQRQRKRTSKPRRFQIFGIKLSQREVIFLGCCVVFILVGAIGIIMSGHSKAPEENKDKTPVSTDNQEPLPAPFQITQSSLSLDPGGQITLSTSGEKSAITWTSSDEKVATVADGVVTGVAGGTATITAASGDELSTCVVTVSGDPYVSNLLLYLNHSDFTIRQGDPAVQMKVKLKESKEVYEGAVVWASANSQVVTISETGLVERVGKGTTTISATVDGQVLECIVRVR